MHYASLTQTVLLGLLAAAPLAAGYGQEAAPEALGERHVGGLAAFAAKMVRGAVPDLTARHHTEAQIAAKKAKAKKEKEKKKGTRDVPAPDEFGPWDSDEDVFGSWVDKRDLDTREPEPHHTEAQIAAKKAKAEKEKEKKKGARDVPAPDEFGPWDSDEDEFGSWVDKRDDVEAREPHHTEAQIAAKKAKAEKEKKKGHNARDEVEIEAREAHHTEAQIAAKKAKAEKEKEKKKGARDVPAPDEFGPWDSDEDEFGSWVDKRDEVEVREPHHTEAQIAAKKAKAEKEKKKGHSARDEAEAEVEAREAHHTEAQIAAKKAKAEKEKKKGHSARDEVEVREPHHTEAQIAAKKAKAEKEKKKAAGH